MKKTMQRILMAAALLLFPFTAVSPSLAGSGGHAPHWGYEGEAGPEHWGHLDHAFTTCIEGKNQSPIDITETTKGNSDNITFNYKASPLKVINNGHTIQVNYEKGSSISVSGKEYELLQFHFHSPSEHTIKGKASDMVVHLVHKSKEGELAVIGVLLEKDKGNTLVQTVWNNIPKKEGKENTVKGITVNAADFLPGNRSYYNYSGSLTTPPCTEGVNWFVLKTSVTVSETQVAKFKSIFKKSVRPVQPRNGRTVKESN